MRQLVMGLESGSSNSPSYYHQIYSYYIALKQHSHSFEIHSAGMSLTPSFYTDALTQFGGPFSGKSSLVRLEKDPTHPMTYCGTVCHKGPRHASHTNVILRKPLYKSGGDRTQPLKVQSMEVYFPDTTQITEVDDKPSLVSQKGGCRVYDIPPRSAKGTVQHLLEQSRAVDFEIHQRLHLSPEASATFESDKRSQQQLSHVSGVSVHIDRRSDNSRHHGLRVTRQVRHLISLG